MRINIALTALFLNIGSSLAANLRSTKVEQMAGQRKIAALTPFDSVFGTMNFVFKGRCDTFQKSVVCERRKRLAELTTKGGRKEPIEIVVCDVDRSGNRENCEKYSFRKGRNVDFVLNKAFPGQIWEMVKSAMIKKFGRPQCRLQVSRKNLEFICENLKTGDEANLVSKPFKDDKEIPVPKFLAGCIGSLCFDSPFNEETPAFEIIQLDLN